VSAQQTLLVPLSWIYGAVSRLRAMAYRRGILRTRRLPGTVISVGNLTTGGTGKTPMVLRIAERLVAEGKRVGILTRGYRGESDAGSAAGTTSDEVRMLQSRLGDAVAFGVGADRYAEGMKLAKLGIERFVMDDGFQHMRLACDVNIVLIDATNPFGGGRLLPAGRLREPHSALGRADIVVITRAAAAAPAIEAAIRRDSRAPIFYAKPRLDFMQEIGGGSSSGASSVAPMKPWFAFCAVGNPDAFFANLREWGLNVTGHKSFPDHHRYSAEDIRDLERAATAAGASRMICTEKDKFNLPPDMKTPLHVYFCSMTLQIDREDEFWKTIQDRTAASILAAHAANA
jgi:tetraacyldisaccharide 4'-kinase